MWTKSDAPFEPAPPRAAPAPAEGPLFRPRGRDGRRGIAVLELTIAIVILTCLALTAILVLVPVSRQSRVNREVAVANTEVEKVLEKVHAVPFKDVTKVYPPGRVIVIDSLLQGRINISYEDPTADPLILKALLTWRSPDLGDMQRAYYTASTE